MNQQIYLPMTDTSPNAIMNSATNTTADPTHSNISDRFTELKLTLPHLLRQQGANPLLVQLVDRLQSHFLSSDQTGQSVSQSSIAQAKQVRDVLTQTEVADASVLVLITNEPMPKLMLTRRASHLNSHAGEVSFAGGKHEVDDGNNVVTALREACEETALPPNRVHLVGQLPVQTSKSGLSVRPIVALTDPDVTYVPELGEIERIFWADLQTLLDQPTQDYEFTFTRSGQTMTLLTPSWQVDGEVVWGLTGRIIANLFEIAFDKQIEWYFKPV